MRLHIIYILCTASSLHAQSKKIQPLSIQTKEIWSAPCEGMSKAEATEAEAYSRAHVKKLQASAELIVAAFKNDFKGIKKALEAGADINAHAENGGLTALMIQATQPASAQIVKFLLKQPGIEVNAVDDRGQTAIHHAARYHNAQAISLLLAHGARTDVHVRGIIARIQRQRQIAARAAQQKKSETLRAESQQEPDKQSWLSFLSSFFSFP